MQRKQKTSSTTTTISNAIADPTFGIFTEYFQYTKEYQEKYGKNTIVLMQVGAFFEVYGIKHTSTAEITGSLIQDLSEICQLNISEKKITYGSPEKQIIMAGFRDFTIDKYLLKLTEAGYTVPVFIQEKDGRSITRKLDRIYSVGTYLSCDTDSSPSISNNIMCVWMETFQPYSRTINAIRDTIVIGVSVINIFTGKSYIFQYETVYDMDTTTFDELERCVSIYSPCEVIFISPFENKDINTILQFSGIKSSTIHRISTIDKKNEKLQNCTNQKYIKQIVSVFFGEEAYDICSEFQNRVMATQSFCYLLNFIQEQNRDLVRKISIPEFNNTSKRMVLANHTLSQLNLIDDTVTDSKKHGNLSSVLSLLNKCCSPMGKRRFQYQLTNPTFDEEWLETEYTMTTKMLSLEPDDFIMTCRKQLSSIRDIEKLCRQLVLKKIYPSSIHHLYKSVTNILEINQSLREHPSICDYLCVGIDSDVTPANQYIQHICTSIIEFIHTHFNIDACKSTSSMTTFDENIIKCGVSNELDKAVKTYEDSQEIFNNIRNLFNDIIQKYEKLDTSTDYVKIHETEKSGACLQITSRRSQILKTILEKDTRTIIQVGENAQFSPKDVKFTKASATNVDIDLPLLNDTCRKLQASKENIQSIISGVYIELLSKLENTYFKELEQIAVFVSKIDVLQCKAYIAKTYNYCSPIIEKTSAKSFVDAYDLRHCLIEHIQQNEIYVTNDLTLGQKQTNGILLYGTNAVGKTSLIRALGIAVVMAQSGLFVPCSRFVYKPYTAIFSRILGNDNIFKGLSTFAVEMSELRTILKMADENSLILGDELCSGTEMESALSIFVTGLQRLHGKHASFIFATHFHEITEYEEIKELTQLNMKHMEVIYDRERDCLVYDRKLRDGSGPRIYGLEVCKSLYLDEEFLASAYAIRNKYYPETRGELSSHKGNSYNSGKLKGKCEKCGEKMGDEIHHLQPQKDANDDGFIGSFHKNHIANLMVLCEKCHTKMHSKETANTINVRKKTTKGYVLATTKV